MTEFIDAKAYLVLQASRKRYGQANAAGLKPVDAGKIVASRTNRPATLERDQIVVRVTVRVPASAFDPISPDALIVVPDSLIQHGQITVEAIDANESTVTE